MRRSLLVVLAVTLAIGVQAGRARADFNVNVGSTTITEGGTGFVDVTISTTDGSSISLASAGFTFNITPVDPLNTRTLEFVKEQPQDMPGTGAYASSYLTNGAYLFFGDSADFLGSTRVGNVTGTAGGTKDQYDGGDSTDSGFNTNDLLSPAKPGSSALLVRLSLTAALDSPPMAGDAYMISLSPTTNTAFQTQADLDTGDREPYTPHAGSVTIAPRSVPEPGSLVLLAAGIPIAGWFVRKRKRTAVTVR